MKRPWRNSLSLAAGTVCALLLLEGGLRLLGAAGAARTQRAAPAAGTHITLLCLGDSYTYGAGAPPAAAYPAQLERLIATHSTARVAVINAGMPAANTAQLLRGLPSLLATHRPRAVLLLAGGANGWNFWGYQAARAPRRRLSDALYRLRVFKLAKLILRAAGEQRRIGRRVHLEQARYEDEYRRFVRAQAANTNDAQPYYAMGAFYLREKDCAEAARWFREGIACDAANPSNYLGLGNALELLGQPEEARTCWARGCTGAAFDATLAERIGHQHLTHGDYAAALAALETACARDPQHHETRVTLSVLGRVATGYHARIAALFRTLPPADSATPALPDLIMPADMQRAAPPARTALLAWVARDLEAMRTTCAAHGAALVILNYPLRHFHTQTDGPVEIENFYNAVNELLAAFAAQHAVPFINNRSVFDQLFGRKMQFFYLTGADEHPNAAGYGLLASNVYALLTAHRLTP